MDSKQILSVGIDIGTSTSQLVFSRLELRNRAAACQIPRFEITDRRIVWQSPVAFTPLTDVDTLDEAALDALIRGWYAEAGVRPEDVETGAVIVTGESLKTVNARRTVMRLADSLGDFVVASAGPHLESVIAGRGAGAAALSEARRGTVLNIDIGGGTSNYAVFRAGRVIDTACFNMGGRLAETDGHGWITRVRKPLLPVLEELYTFFMMKEDTLYFNPHHCISGDTDASSDSFTASPISIHTTASVVTVKKESLPKKVNKFQSTPLHQW